MTLNIGATCGTCKFQDKSNPSACHQCMNRNGRPGWEPAEGVEVRYGEDCLGRTTRRPITGGAA